MRSETGQLMRRATDLRALLKLGITVPLDYIPADELYTMLIIEEEVERRDEEEVERRDEEKANQS